MRFAKCPALIVLVSALALALTGCDIGSKPTQRAGPMFTDEHGLFAVPKSSPLRSRLAVQPVNVGGEEVSLDLPAAVEADPARVTNILAPVAGRLVSLRATIGEHVAKGQVLAVMSSGDFAQARTDELKAKDAADLARKVLERARGVHAAGGSAAKDLESAQSGYNQAAAELSRAQARMLALNGSANSRSSNLVLRAPQNGIVSALSVGQGAQISDPTASLMTITNLDRVFVTANLAEADVGAASVGTDAKIVLAADPAHPLQGKITEVNWGVEPDTRRQKVRIAIGNSGWRLLPNMYATVHLSSRSRGAVLVPQSALLMNNDNMSVLVEVRPWVFQRRSVEVGDETETAVRILRGLGPGDRVVVRGGVLLND